MPLINKPHRSAPDENVVRTFTLQLHSDVEEVSRARRSVRVELSAWGLASVADDMALLTTELVANAVHHGDGPIALHLQQRGPTVLLEVDDSSPRPPVFKRTDAFTESGRGLWIVAIYSDRWGHRPQQSGPGKTVWCSKSIKTVASGPDTKPALRAVS